MQGEKERARVPVAERELGGPARWRVREEARLSLVTNLLATFAIATIILHKTSLVRSKNGLVFFGVIA
jgi:hypothetical protein